MASNKVSFFLILFLCVLSTAEAQNPTGRKCEDPNGVDKKAECYIYCNEQGFLGGSCQGYKNHYLCECYVG
ncbi:putative defensin-like protein 33 isoform X2 [Arabidopsis lyrata subsp. lyrata]|uniref:putative defensin-like protein 33 isoform X2 n=1 Tax=Arabidopsis lyrata subsp. lyrata TaxID=81972 RepID=UPI000A29CC68|nr:putative defensin-like protein 33 isoform X2 [Arabidopsis lyrata subsp. lyrata]|eukprot:XP_020890185.1 putative defensin-like protein 33 isoform X2 [Arabidopsis lyrata subsp. lyrata]